MKSFKVQFFNKSGNLEVVVINADTETAARKSISNRDGFDMLVCCKLV